MKNNFHIEYEAYGNPNDQVIVLISGMGAQMISWSDDFCHLLASGRRYVIRFDNRDCGLSTKFNDSPIDFQKIHQAALKRDIETMNSLAVYTLKDMANDVIYLLDKLNINKAHIIGSSMGGMIAQLVAITHPHRVHTLTSIMSTTGEPEYGQPTPEASEAIFSLTPDNREDYATVSARKARIWSSRKYFDQNLAQELALKNFDRCYYPEGSMRQLAALLATGSLAEGLKKIDVPALIIHGLDDTLITPSGGERTAGLIKNSKLLLVTDMGHDRPQQLWPFLTSTILDHTNSF